MNEAVAIENNLTDKQVQYLEDVGIDNIALQALRASVFPDPNISDHSIALYLAYCHARKLDPMKKPAHIVNMKVGDVYRDVIMPGIYEYRTTAQRTGQYAGCDSAVLGPEQEMEFGQADKKDIIKAPISCTFTVYKMINGTRCPFTHTVYFKEACGTKKYGLLNAMWKKRPIGQLMKCAEAGALRMAFPEELGGEMTVDEMQGQEIIEAKPPEEKMNITQDQVDHYEKLINEGRALEFYLYTSEFHITDQCDLEGAWVAKAPKGKKVQWRNTRKELEEHGKIEFQDIVEILDQRSEADDEHGFAEVWNAMSDYEKKLAAELSIDQPRMLIMGKKVSELKEE